MRRSVHVGRSAMATVLVWTAGAAGQTLNWAQPVSGSFTDPARWSPQQAPTAGATCVFGNPLWADPFDVTLASSQSISGLSVNGQSPVFRLTGATLTVSTLTLGSGPASAAPTTLTIDGGTLRALGGLLGGAGPRSIVIQNGGVLDAASVSWSLSSATVSAVGGSQVRSRGLGVGTNQTSSALLVSGGTWTDTGPSVSLGSSGVGRLRLDSGAVGSIASTGRLDVGAQFPSSSLFPQSSVELDGAGTTLTVATLGAWDGSVVSVSGGATLSAGSVSVGRGRGSRPTRVSVTGVGSTLATTGSIELASDSSTGDRPPARMVVAGGGRVIGGGGSVLRVRTGAELFVDGVVPRVDVQGGVFSPGDGPGRIGTAILAGGLGSGSGGRVVMEIGPGGLSDQIVVPSGTSLGVGSLELALAPGFVAVPGQRYPLVLGSSAGSLSGTLAAGPGLIFTRLSSGSGLSVEVASLTGVQVMPNPINVYRGFPATFSVTGVTSLGSTVITGNAVTVSAAPSIVAVEGAGRLRGMEVGSTVVTSSFAGVEGQTAVTVLALPPQPPAVRRVSLTSGSGQIGNGASCCSAALAAGGDAVAFAAGDASVVTPSAGTQVQIYLRRLGAGTTSLVSASAGGLPADAACSAPAISADGRFVAFVSAASNLGVANPSGGANVYVKDMVTGTIDCVSVTPGGAAAGGCIQASISDDGRVVAFSSSAALTAGDQSGNIDVFVAERAGSGQPVTVRLASAAGQTAVGVGGFSPVVSGDGSRVVFFSDAINLVSGDTNTATDVFAWTTASGAVVRASTTSVGQQTDGVSTFSGPLSVSGTGRFVAFTTFASQFGLTGSGSIVVKDLVSGAATIELAVAGQATASAESPQISADARYLAFLSRDSTLPPVGGRANLQVFLRDRLTGDVRVLSKNFFGEEASASTTMAGVTASGDLAAFVTTAGNLVPFDTNERSDVFVASPAPGGVALCLGDVTGIGGPPSAPDGQLTGDDFNAFVGAFAAGDGLADITGIGGPPSGPDGAVTGDDFVAFIGAFAAGCP